MMIASGNSFCAAHAGLLFEGLALVHCDIHMPTKIPSEPKPGRACGEWTLPVEFSVAARSLEGSEDVNDLIPIAERVAAILKQRKQTIAVAESSSGGLIAASMLSVAGASAYFLGGAVIYTRAGFHEYLSEQAFTNLRGLQEDTAVALARAMRDKWQSSWGIAEIGAAGPAGNRYGDPPGTSCIAVVGSAERSATIRTGSDNRVANMRAFASEALNLLSSLLELR